MLIVQPIIQSPMATGKTISIFNRRLRISPLRAYSLRQLFAGC
jgi:hypothetical protein